jgi:rhodanese-related sulfurtransferase
MFDEITPKDLKARLDAGEDIDIIDVREDWEVAIGKVTPSIHIPMNSIPDRIHEISMDKPVVILCHSGNRSFQVSQWLTMQGYENVMNLDGGITRWSKDVDPSINPG